MYRVRGVFKCSQAAFRAIGLLNCDTNLGSGRRRRSLRGLSPRPESRSEGRRSSLDLQSSEKVVHIVRILCGEEARQFGPQLFKLLDRGGGMRLRWSKQAVCRAQKLSPC